MTRIGSYLNNAAPAHFLEQIGQTLADMIRYHIRSFISELKKKIKIQNTEWATSQEGSEFLDAIDDKTGRSSDHDVGSTFWLLNTKLPSSRRFVYLPMPGYKDNYCSKPRKISESVKAFISSPGCTAQTGKYVLAGTLLTDGLQLKVHAYSLVQPKKTKDDETVSDDTQSSSSSSASTSQLTLKGTSACNTKSKMEYLTKAIPDIEALKEQMGNQEIHVVLAIDPGIKSTATAVVVDSLNPEKSWNLSFSKGCHSWNSTRYTRNMRNHKKCKRLETTDGAMSVNDREAIQNMFI
ncbi:hypothetical protein BGX26_004623 [Mortierella sp. AD094]|nr:hypothetical protein BGX26_004623 [Mortierella sp. AD094]